MKGDYPESYSLLRLDQHTDLIWRPVPRLWRIRHANRKKESTITFPTAEHLQIWFRDTPSDVVVFTIG